MLWCVWRPTQICFVYFKTFHSPDCPFSKVIYNRCVSFIHMNSKGNNFSFYLFTFRSLILEKENFPLNTMYLVVVYSFSRVPWSDQWKELQLQITNTINLIYHMRWQFSDFDGCHTHRQMSRIHACNRNKWNNHAECMFRREVHCASDICCSQRPPSSVSNRTRFVFIQTKCYSGWTAKM